MIYMYQFSNAVLYYLTDHWQVSVELPSCEPISLDYKNTSQNILYLERFVYNWTVIVVQSIVSLTRSLKFTFVKNIKHAYAICIDF